MATGTEMGEYLVGAYLTVLGGCTFVDYNVHPPGGGMRGLDELDVVGFNFESEVAYICEVTTHIRGLLYRDYDTTVNRVSEKFARQKRYAKKCLDFLPNHRFMFWSPVVASGLADRLRHIRGLELVINGEYSKRINLLQSKARLYSHDLGNPAFRVFQILEHMRKEDK